jgi:TusA-related sulfurtransferase
VGQILALTTDAPHAPREIRSLVEHLGHQLVSGEATGGGHRFMIRRL